MSKFIICSTAVRSKFDEHDYTFSRRVSDVYVLARNKLNVNDGIFYENGEDWVLCVGTYIYKHTTGEEALKQILSDFKDSGDIVTLKKRIIGIYAICLYKSKKFFVFNDYYGLYDINYVENKDIKVSTNLSDIINEKSDINECPFMVHGFTGFDLSNETIICGVKRLRGDEYLLIENTSNVCKICPKEYRVEVPEYTNVENAIEYIIKQLSPIVIDIGNLFKDIDICMTGGLDSRTILASFERNKVKVNHLVYGLSNTFHIMTCKEDREIVSKIAKFTNIPEKILDWNSPEPIDGLDMKWQEALFHDVGYYNNIYCGNKNFVKSITSLDTRFLEFGYFLEALRLREWIEANHSNKTFSVNQLIDRYFNVFENLEYANKYALFEWIRKAFTEELASLNINNLELIPIEQFNRVEWMLRERISDSRMHLFINNYFYSFPVFSVPYVHEFILKIPNVELSRSAFQIKLLLSLNQDLLKVPIFSHRRKYIINNKGEKVLKNNLKNYFTKIGYEYPVVLKYMLPMYQSLKYKNSSAFNNTLIKDLDKILRDNSINFIDINNYKGDVSRLFNLRQSCLCIKNAKLASCYGDKSINDR